MWRRRPSRGRSGRTGRRCRWKRCTHALHALAESDAFPSVWTRRRRSRCRSALHEMAGRRVEAGRPGADHVLTGRAHRAPDPGFEREQRWRCRPRCSASRLRGQGVGAPGGKRQRSRGLHALVPAYRHRAASPLVSVAVWCACPFSFRPGTGLYFAPEAAARNRRREDFGQDCCSSGSLSPKAVLLELPPRAARLLSLTGSPLPGPPSPAAADRCGPGREVARIHSSLRTMLSKSFQIRGCSRSYSAGRRRAVRVDVAPAGRVSLWVQYEFVPWG